MTGRKPRIAVLGAGIMGCCAAMFLARRGAAVTLFDRADRPFSAASRWNEGKIHLGYIYSADATLRTAEHVMAGGFHFRPLIEALLETTIAPVITSQDDIYLCHRQSVVPVDAMASYMEQVTRRVATHPDAPGYLFDVSGHRHRRLSASELDDLTASPDIVGGFRVPERSVETTWIADRFLDAIAAEKGIEARMRAEVTAVRPLNDSVSGPWRVETALGTFKPYDYVVNALWQGRLAIDRTAGLSPKGVWSNRYRQSLFVHTKEALTIPCVIIATGPFGDIKNYDGRHFYLSWYPEGLRVTSTAVSPPAVESLSMPDPERLTRSVLENLEAYLPCVAEIRQKAEAVVVEGGWVFAAGRGQLSDPGSSLHRRSDYGLTRSGNYISVDTGKYSTAPWLANLLAHELLD